MHLISMKPKKIHTMERQTDRQTCTTDKDNHTRS